MKRFLVIFVVLIFVVGIFGQSKYTTYNNERFAYSIDYPSNLLKMQPPPANGDGREFASEDKSVKMLVWREYNALEQSLDEKYQSDLKNYGAGVSYKVLLKDGFVISGIKDNQIFYQKTLRRKMKQIDVFYTFTIEYDKSENENFNSIVERIAKSFKFDPQADV